MMTEERKDPWGEVITGPVSLKERLALKRWATSAQRPEPEDKKEEIQPKTQVQQPDGIEQSEAKAVPPLWDPQDASMNAEPGEA